MSEVPGQSGHALPDRIQQDWAKDRQFYNAISMIYAFAVLFRLARQDSTCPACRDCGGSIGKDMLTTPLS